MKTLNKGTQMNALRIVTLSLLALFALTACPSQQADLK
jgi:hypothetical protein